MLVQGSCDMRKLLRKTARIGPTVSDAQGTIPTGAPLNDRCGPATVTFDGMQFVHYCNNVGAQPTTDKQPHLLEILVQGSFDPRKLLRKMAFLDGL